MDHDVTLTGRINAEWLGFHPTSVQCNLTIRAILAGGVRFFQINFGGDMFTNVYLEWRALALRGCGLGVAEGREEGENSADPPDD